MVGKDETSFDHSGIVSRAEFVTVLARLACHNAEAGGYGEKLAFADTDTDAWYADYAGWAVETGLVMGLPDNKFGPNEPVTREQMAVFIERLITYMKKTLPDNPKVSSFNDAGKVTEFAASAVDAMRMNGIIEGTPEGDFRPLDTADRASVATIAKILFPISVLCL